ncbi:MAG: biotin--[acetyl-CoA-carboxylase] ligase [Hydrogenobacter sp.]|uniref:biotin--[acetyl-CoA-carboxylase] ligase n=1 Tax=Hydrogenobacter thermophilus TaxID=940 RepID=UPI0030FA3128
MKRFLCMLWLEEVSSTQDYLKDKMSLNCVVVARTQRLGRGRYGRFWHSDMGGLYFSFSLKESFKDEQALPLVLSLSVCQLLEDYGFFASIKWINDVYLKGKKICGILVEKVKDRIIAGIGLNVNQENFPEGLQATSMLLVSGRKYDTIEVLFRLLKKIDRNLDLLKERGFGDFREDIKKRLLFLGEEVVLQTDPPTVGILTDLSPEGQIILLTAEGEKRVISGDITLRGTILS